MFTFSTQEQFVLEQIKAAANVLQYEVYAIGGFVRDKILGRPSKDIDIVCVGDGLLLAEEVAKNLPNITQVNFYKTYGTAQIKTNSIEIEFVGARKESYAPESRNPKVEPGTIKDDQTRRDFTINALAISLNANNFGILIDPFNGLKHIEEKKLITPTDPDITFIDDPLRMMRAIRFACQLQFTIEPYTFASIKENAARIKIITQERITTELQKIMASPKPSIGWQLLEDAGLLPYILPELHKMKGVEDYGGKKHKDNFYHTLQVLDNLSATSENIWLRWAALLHDIAKPQTKKFVAGTGWTFHNHEFIGSKMVPKIFNKLKLPLGAEMKFVQLMVALHQRPISLTKAEITDSAIRRVLFEAGEHIDDLMLLCNADITSKDATRVSRYKNNYILVQERMKAVEEADNMRAWQPPITGDIIMNTFNIGQGRVIGDIKDGIRDAILDGAIPNNYDAAFALMLQLGADKGLKMVN